MTIVEEHASGCRSRTEPSRYVAWSPGEEARALGLDLTRKKHARLKGSRDWARLREDQGLRQRECERVAKTRRSSMEEAERAAEKAKARREAFVERAANDGWSRKGEGHRAADLAVDRGWQGIVTARRDATQQRTKALERARTAAIAELREPKRVAAQKLALRTERINNAVQDQVHLRHQHHHQKSEEMKPTMSWTTNDIVDVDGPIAESTRRRVRTEVERNLWPSAHAQAAAAAATAALDAADRVSKTLAEDSARSAAVVAARRAADRVRCAAEKAQVDAGKAASRGRAAARKVMVSKAADDVRRALELNARRVNAVARKRAVRQPVVTAEKSSRSQPALAAAGEQVVQAAAPAAYEAALDDAANLVFVVPTASSPGDDDDDITPQLPPPRPVDRFPAAEERPLEPPPPPPEEETPHELPADLLPDVTPLPRPYLEQPTPVDDLIHQRDELPEETYEEEEEEEAVQVEEPPKAQDEEPPPPDEEPPAPAPEEEPLEDETMGGEPPVPEEEPPAPEDEMIREVTVEEEVPPPPPEDEVIREVTVEEEVPPPPPPPPEDEMTGAVEEAVPAPEEEPPEDEGVDEEKDVSSPSVEDADIPLTTSTDEVPLTTTTTTTTTSPSTDDTTSGSGVASILRWARGPRAESPLSSIAEGGVPDEYLAADAVDETLIAAERLLEDLERDDRDDDDDALEDVLKRLDGLADSMRSRDLTFEPKVDVLRHLQQSTSSLLGGDDDDKDDDEPGAMSSSSSISSTSMNSSVDDLLRRLDFRGIATTLASDDDDDDDDVTDDDADDDGLNDETDTTSDAADILASLLSSVDLPSPTTA